MNSYIPKAEFTADLRKPLRIHPVVGTPDPIVIRLCTLVQSGIHVAPVFRVPRSHFNGFSSTVSS